MDKNINAIAMTDSAEKACKLGEDKKKIRRKVETTDYVLKNDGIMHSVIRAINIINSHCDEIDALEDSIKREYGTQKDSILNKSNELINNMKRSFDAFKLNFTGLKNEVNDLVDLLCEDYKEEWETLDVDIGEYESQSYIENDKKLHKLIEDLNARIVKLNNVDFCKLVPPILVEVKDEKFVTYTENRSYVKEYDCDSPIRKSTKTVKPLKNVVVPIYQDCKSIIACVDAMQREYERKFNVEAFNSHVKNSARSWLSEIRAQMESRYIKRFDELFKDDAREAIPKTFFTELKKVGEKSNVDVYAGASSYNETLTLGDAELLIEDSQQHLNYIKNSPVLCRYITGGKMVAPVVLNLRKCGNLLINVDEDIYSPKTSRFVNQLIVQFLLSFPANRINFCLVDIDNKMGFSQFKSLTKINNNILFNGIIRDDRQLENTIKDLEQTMYKIDDDILSYNNVSDIYEYNERFEANPQNVHLFVLVNYPSGMRDDIAKRIMKIVQNGNKTGIFSIIINNKSCPLSPGYKPEEVEQFVDTIEKNSLVLNKIDDDFTLNLSVKNRFIPQDYILNYSSLADIIEMLKANAETNRQKVIPLTQMFESDDNERRSSKGMDSYAEVLDIPIGARGGDIQNILLKTTGDGSAHAVVIGGTGSGKSNLLHTIIMSACYKYSPEELNLYLIDFKGGVEFKYYEANKIRERQIPHIKLTGLTSDLDDGVAILNNLHKELRRREDEFRKCRVEDIVQYNNLGKKIPRLFVIIDEIQELFEQDDKLGQKAIDILRELFKKGRAFGISILWASQNIPKVPGLKDKVLSQIGNRISLRLNEPDDALDIKIDPKVVKNLNRPEKGLGVINDIRYGNESIEFRVAFAESSENRQKYSQKIIEKWSEISDLSNQEPLFIVGDDDEPSPVAKGTIYSVCPTKNNIVSKSFESYTIQLGQDYVTGKPYTINVVLRQNKMNVLFAGYDIEILRDMMGYSLLSVVINQLTNADCVAEGTKIYYANGEMINPKNSGDLYNVIRSDFSHIIENVSPTEKMLSCIRDVYRLYKQRSLESDKSEYAKNYTPCFVVIHSMQRYIDLFNDNPSLKLTDQENGINNREEANKNSVDITASDLDRQFHSVKPRVSFHSSHSAPSSGYKMADSVFLSDAVKELLDRGGKVGIHFIISIDNPLSISAIKNELSETMYKVFVKGVNANVITQMLGDYRASNSLSNPRIALVACQDERSKILVYRYDKEHDFRWYTDLRCNYDRLRRE